MNFPYSAQNKLTAAEYNEVVKAAGIYAADSGSANAYVITVSPVPSSLITGMTFKFKAGFANTAAATINVNGLGAKTIKKNYNNDLIANDIVAGQLVAIQYDGTNFQLLSPVPPVPAGFTSGIITRALNGSSGVVNTAHNLGGIPRKVKMSAFLLSDSSSIIQKSRSVGVFIGGATNTIKETNAHSSSNIATATDTTNMVAIAVDGYGQNGVLTVDSTNLIMTWTIVGSPGAANIGILWEAWA